MKVTIEHDVDGQGNIRRSIVEDGCVTADETLQLCIDAMLGQGFQEVSIKEAIQSRAEEYETSK